MNGLPQCEKVAVLYIFLQYLVIQCLRSHLCILYLSAKPHFVFHYDMGHVELPLINIGLYWRLCHIAKYIHR